MTMGAAAAGSGTGTRCPSPAQCRRLEVGDAADRIVVQGQSALEVNAAGIVLEVGLAEITGTVIQMNSQSVPPRVPVNELYMYQPEQRYAILKVFRGGFRAAHNYRVVTGG